MKNAASIASHTPGLLAICLVLSGLALAQHAMQSTGAGDQSNLVQTVRDATKQYVDVNNATAAGYGPFLGCVSGSDHGAMGIHYVNPNLLNGTVDATHPQALIYEPSNGQMKLVGVEFIVDAATWLKTNPGPPVLEGQVFLLVDSPNRFNIPAFFELHVWAWRDNPQGSFVDWNNQVSCAHQ
jgi:hypothetical protein